MCTVSWYREAGGYRLFFNRDERRERAAAVPPTISSAGTTRYVAPKDPEAGGTWILVNDRGVSICLLNGFESGGRSSRPAEAAAPSRGYVPRWLAGSRSAAQAIDDLRAHELDPYRPFVLAALDPGGDVLYGRWSGRDGGLHVGPLAHPPLVSSSLFTDEVRASRTTVFARLTAAAPAEARAERYVAFHRSHEPERGPHSPCMHREDARTVSFTEIRVTEGRVWLGYTGDAPCRGRHPADAIELRRADVGTAKG